MFRCPLMLLTLSNDLPWPPKWRSFQNTSSYTCGVSFHRFFGVENPILRSDWCLEVNWSHWRCPMASFDFQNGVHFRIHPLTHVGCLFRGFRGCRIRIWGQIKYSRHFWGHWGRPRSLKDLLTVNHCKIIINTCFEILRCVRGDILKWPPFRRSREAIGQRRWPQLTSKHQFDPKFEFSAPKNLGKETPHVWEGVFWNDLHFGGQGRPLDNVCDLNWLIWSKNFRLIFLT